MALDIDEIAGKLVRGTAPEMIKADIVERRSRLKARDMTAQFGGLFVGPDDDRECIPADNRANTPLDLAIARIARLALHWDRINVGCIGVIRQKGAALARFANQIFEQI